VAAAVSILEATCGRVMVEEDSALGAGVGAGETGCAELSEGLEEDVGFGEGDGLCAGAGARFDEEANEESDKEEREVDAVGSGTICDWSWDDWTVAVSCPFRGVVLSA